MIVKIVIIYYLSSNFIHELREKLWKLNVFIFEEREIETKELIVYFSFFYIDVYANSESGHIFTESEFIKQ